MELNRFGAKKKHLLALVLAAGLLLGDICFPAGSSLITIQVLRRLWSK